ncbi:hypothetical protein ACFLU6_15405, partial [Acidobacteriota bacterium]
RILCPSTCSSKPFIGLNHHEGSAVEFDISEGIITVKERDGPKPVHDGHIRSFFQNHLTGADSVHPHAGLEKIDVIRHPDGFEAL